MIIQSWYFNAQDRDQRGCFEEKFSELSVALDARADLTEKETAQNKALWLIYANAAGLVKDDPTKPLKPADQERLQRELVKQLLEYKDTITTIERERQKNPLPPYPVGVCDR
jgi:hypothetical protein